MGYGGSNEPIISTVKASTTPLTLAYMSIKTLQSHALCSIIKINTATIIANQQHHHHQPWSQSSSSSSNIIVELQQHHCHRVAVAHPMSQNNRGNTTSSDTIVSHPQFAQLWFEPFGPCQRWHNSRNGESTSIRLSIGPDSQLYAGRADAGGLSRSTTDSQTMFICSRHQV